ncbi:hypothetical protein [Bacillus cihuensis]|nr:hypothetical protein [Bacillus cihuensis]
MKLQSVGFYRSLLRNKFSFDVLPSVLYDMKEENARAKTGEVHS